MAETIKGINVVIGAETTGLSKALSDVNKQSRNIQSELKQVEKLLKLDPTNTDLVAQKQKLLGDAVAATREKLDRLKAAQEQVNQQFAKGEISEGQYRAFQREIAATEQALNRLEQQGQETKKSLADLGTSLQNTGDKMKGAGEKMSLAITAPIVAAGGVMLKGALEAEAATGKLQAALGLTADEAADLSAVAESVWVNGFGENIEEVNNAIKDVRLNMGLLAEDELDKATQGAMTIAEVFDQDVKEVAAAAGVAMKNFGLSGQEALDLITVGFQQGGDYSGELLDTIREYAPQFASLGLSAEQAMSVLVSGAQAGAWNLDKVGDAMKEFNIRAQDGSKTTAEGFTAIGLDAQKMGSDIAAGGDKAQQAFMATVTALAAVDDNLKFNQAGVALFGTQWEDLRGDVILAMQDGMNSLGEFQGATEAAAKAAYENNPGLALTMALRELQAAIGPALLPLADMLKNTVVPAIKSVAEWFSNLSPEGQKVALVIAGIAAAVGPLLVVIGFLASSIGSIVGLYATWTAAAAATAAGTATVGATSAAATPAVTGLGAAFKFLLGPIGLAIAAIAAVIAIGIAVYKNWDEIKEKLSQIWTGIKDTASKIWDGLKDFFRKWGVDLLLIATGPVGWAVLLGKTLAQNWDTIKQTALNVWNAIKTGISGIWNSITSATSGAISGLQNAVRSGLESAWNYIKSIPSQAIQWGRNIIQALVNGIKAIRIPLPHIGVTWDSYSVGGKTINVPDFGINWYAKGGIFASPSVIGVGEAGTEVVAPLDELKKYLGNGQPVEVILKLDSAVLSRQLVYLNQGKLRGAGV